MMNTLMTLAVIDSCCVEVCKHCSQLENQSAWNEVIKNIPVIVVLALLSVVFIFLVGYTIEYIKIKAQYLRQTNSNIDRELQNIKTIVNDINSKINTIKTPENIIEIEKKFREDLANWEKSIENIENQNKILNEKVDKLIKEKNDKSSNQETNNK